jgi:hypothetical protein
MFYCFNAHHMKKIYILIIVLFSLQSFSQKDYSRYYNSWRLGLNLGGAWQTADYRSCWGMAGGFTLEKGLHENSTNFFSFAIRGRYLAANTYGMDLNRNYDVKSNDAYNGKYDPVVNFVDSVPVNRQYVFDNYKMTLGEGSLELQLSFNRLRERTHVILNLWGGVGVTSYRTKSDLLDGDKKMYNFSLVDSTGNKTKTLNSYNGLIDKSYESYAYGSRNGNLVTFSPSAGIGLGYQFSPGFSVLWEYKLTLPQGTNADLLDGKLSMNNDGIGGNNDYYHYTGLNLLFTLRGKKKTTTPKDETVYTNTIVPTTTTSVPTTSVVPTSSVVITPPPTHTITTLPPKEQRPIVSFMAPASNGLVVNNQQYKISAQVLNVSASNSIQFIFNGASHSDYTYNAQTHVLEYNAILINGTNSIQITASNTAGSDTKQTSVVYEQPRPAGNPPLVSYINPVQPGTTVSTKTYVVKAQVLNVSLQKNISVYFNGMSAPFTFNTTTKQISVAVELNAGSNSISVTANNTLGEDTKTSTIIFKENKPAGVPPVVSLVNPASEINTTGNLMYNFKLSVLNVVSKNDIIMMLNGNQVSSFTYDPASGFADLSINLAIGDNTLTVKGNNAFGTDSKTIRVNYQPEEKAKTPPVLTITTPSNSPSVSSGSNYIFRAKVSNITAKSQVTVKFNGNAVLNFVFTFPNIICPVTLIPGSNIFEVTATNNDGTDTKNAIVTLKPKDVPVLPIVNLISPSATITNIAASLYTFKLGVLNVNSKSDIEVIFNGSLQSNFTYDPASKELVFQTNLASGNNNLSVKGTNPSGSDSKQLTVIYTPPVEIKSLPFVTISHPSSDGTTTTNANHTFKATVSNVENTTGITVKFNGNIITNYTFDGFNLTYPAVLVQGSNLFEIKAVNNDGTDVKSRTVNFRLITKPVPPTVNLITPSSLENTTENSMYNFKLSVLKVNSKADIEVLFNGISQLNFTYDATAKEVNFQTNLIVGENTLLVKGTNQFGSDFKQIKVTYAPHVEIKRPPSITFVAPANGSGSSQNPTFVYQASITEIPNVNGLTVKYNGVAVSNFSYDGATLTYSATLISGNNSLQITITNNDGNDDKTAIVNYRPVQPPVVVILQPVNTPTVVTPSFTFQFKVMNVTKKQMEVTLNGAPVTSYNFVSTAGSFSANLVPGTNTLTVKGTNTAGTQVKTAQILYIPQDSLITNTPGTTNGTPDDNERKMTICHFPPGNNQNPQTLLIPYSAWPAHQAHGDLEGACPSKNDSVKVNEKPGKNINNEGQPKEEETGTPTEKPIITPRKPR